MMSINNKLLKTGLWSLLFGSAIALSACQKQGEEAPDQAEEPEVTMSAEPADSNEPAIVADDLDAADAQSEQASDTDVLAESAEAVNNEANIDDSSQIEPAENAPVTDSDVGSEAGAITEEVDSDAQ